MTSEKLVPSVKSAVATPQVLVKIPSTVVNQDSIEDSLKKDNAAESVFQSGFLTDFGEKGQPSLEKFFTALRDESSSDKVRIAYYGDSLIEGDLICMDLRPLLQKKFGGKGPGFLRITSIDSPFRTFPRHTYSKDWKSIDLSGKVNPRIALGISGATSVSTRDSWVKYSFDNVEQKYSDINLYYSGGRAGSLLKYTINSTPERSLPLEAGEEVKSAALLMPVSVKGAQTLKVMLPSDAHSFYGVSIDEGNGIYVDNFPLRGNSGLNLTSIPGNILKDFDSLLSYRLIILQFGINIAQAGSTQFGWYETGMNRVVAHFKKAFPDSSIMIVSVGDKSTKKGDEYRTDICIPRLVEAQRRVARHNKIAFFDMYHAMGGENSMLKWAEKGLAAKDYTHISRGGGKKIAQQLFNSLMDGYENFL